MKHTAVEIEGPKVLDFSIDTLNANITRKRKRRQMRHTLTFNVPEEREELELTLNASKYYCTLHDIAQWLRSECKYADPDGTMTYEEFRTKFYGFLEDNDVSL